MDVEQVYKISFGQSVVYAPAPAPAEQLYFAFQPSFFSFLFRKRKKVLVEAFKKQIGRYFGVLPKETPPYLVEPIE